MPLEPSLLEKINKTTATQQNSPRRLGRFHISASLVRSDVQLVAKIFAVMEVVVVRCEMEFASDILRYEGISPLFREIKDYQIPPEYVITIDQTPGQSLSVSADEIDYSLKTIQYPQNKFITGKIADA